MGKISSQTPRRAQDRLSVRDRVTEPAGASLVEIAGSGGHS
jgi:hypothetical protein